MGKKSLVVSDCAGEHCTHAQKLMNAWSSSRYAACIMQYVIYTVLEANLQIYLSAVKFLFASSSDLNSLANDCRNRKACENIMSTTHFPRLQLSQS